jgi:hypothetical protein
MTYRCFFLGADNKIKEAEIIECATDAAALEEAEQKLAASKYLAIEVWDGARRVGTVGQLKDQAELPQDPSAMLRPAAYEAGG